MPAAFWNKILIAQSDDVVEIENSVYFPRKAVRTDLLIRSDTVTRCPWKGTATYYSIRFNNVTVKDSAWSYENTRSRARMIQGYVAFWKSVIISQ